MNNFPVEETLIIIMTACAAINVYFGNYGAATFFAILAIRYP